MTTFKKTMLTLSMLALPMLVFSAPADARRMVPKYKKTATVYRAQQAKQLRGKYQPRSNFRKSWKKAPKKVIKPTRPATKRLPNIKPTTTRTYISRSLHKQAGMNYFLRGKNVRVTNVKVDGNRMMFKDSGKWLGWTAKVNLKGGDTYNAQGFVRQGRDGQPKGLKRVKIQSSTPTPGIIVR